MGRSAGAFWRFYGVRSHDEQQGLPKYLLRMPPPQLLQSVREDRWRGGEKYKTPALKPKAAAAGGEGGRAAEAGAEGNTTGELRALI